MNAVYKDLYMVAFFREKSNHYDHIAVMSVFYLHSQKKKMYFRNGKRLLAHFLCLKLIDSFFFLPILKTDHRRNHENVSEILPTGLQTQDKSSKNPVRHTPVSRARLLLQHFLRVLRIGLRTVNSNTRKKKIAL